MPPLWVELAVAGVARQAEIHQPHPHRLAVERDHDVVGLDVAVHHAAGMAVFERLGALRGDLQHLAEVQAAAFGELAQGGAFDHRHHQEKRAEVLAEVEDRHDARMVHLGDQPRLAPEAVLGVRPQALPAAAS